MYFAGKLVYLIVLPSNQLAINELENSAIELESSVIELESSLIQLESSLIQLVRSFIIHIKRAQELN